MSDKEKLVFHQAEFVNEDGEMKRVGDDPAGRISEIDVRIAELNENHRMAASSWEEQELEKTIQELLQERAQLEATLGEGQPDVLSHGLRTESTAKLYDFQSGNRISVDEHLESQGATPPNFHEEEPLPGSKDLFAAAVDVSVERIKAEALEREAQRQGRILDVGAKKDIQAAKMDANDVMSRLDPADQARAHSQALDRLRRESEGKTG